MERNRILRWATKPASVPHCPVVSCDGQLLATEPSNNYKAREKSSTLVENAREVLRKFCDKNDRDGNALYGGEKKIRVIESRGACSLGNFFGSLPVTYSTIFRLQIFSFRLKFAESMGPRTIQISRIFILDVSFPFTTLSVDPSARYSKQFYFIFGGCSLWILFRCLITVSNYGLCYINFPSF